MGLRRLLFGIGVRDRDGYSGTQIVIYTETGVLYLVSSFIALSARGSELGNAQHLKVSRMYINNVSMKQKMQQLTCNHAICFYFHTLPVEPRRQTNVAKYLRRRCYLLLSRCVLDVDEPALVRLAYYLPHPLSLLDRLSCPIRQ